MNNLKLSISQIHQIFLNTGMQEQNIAGMMDLFVREAQASSTILHAPHANVTLPFPKHKGKTMAAIYLEDPAYLIWLYSWDKLKDEFKGPLGEFLKAVLDE